MKWLGYAFTGAAVMMLGCVVARSLRARPTRDGRSPAGRAVPSRIGQEAEDQAIARAQSEVASGEYDMQG